MSLQVWFYIGLFVLGIVLFSCYSRNGKMLKSILFSAATGVPALGLLWALSQVTAFTLVVTPFTFLVSALLGIPGVLSMLVMNLI